MPVPVDMVYCTRRIQFCAGHRVMLHESKCRHLHGHNYVVHIAARRAEDQDRLDMQGRVIDFSVLKEVIGGWIEANWDHGYLLHQHDHAAQAAMSAFSKVEGIQQKLYLLPYNPTAENIAIYLQETVCGELLAAKLPGIEILRVVVEETENCSATSLVFP